MMAFRSLILSVLMLGLLAAAPLSAQPTSATPRVVGYYASWGIYDRQYFVTNIPADKLTHLNYAFASISDSGEIALSDEWADTQFPYPGDPDDATLKGNFNQLQILKAAHPNLQTLISVGGWTGSAKFSDVALTAASRDKFARSVVAFVTQYGFDGVDIDWEYPTGNGDAGNVERPEDSVNFVLLLAALRAQLDAQGAQDGHHYLVTIALGSNRDEYAPLDWKQIVPSLDWINVMDYDMSGPWSSTTSFNAPLYAAGSANSHDISTRSLLGLGVPADKLVMGVPFYGQGWTGVAPTNNGLNQAFIGVPGTDGGTFTYRDLVAKPIGTRFWDNTAESPWMYDKASGTMIAYDDPESLAKKAQYVRANKLGGMMIWELSQDTDDSALLNAINTGLNGS